MSAAVRKTPGPSADEGAAAGARAGDAAGGCPSDAAFARLIEGTLDAVEVRRLEAHCDGCADCARTLAELARTITPAEGDWLGERYQLGEPLGAGGMGVVTTAIDTKLRRKVAVKRLRETGGAAAAERRRARFLREAQLLASLSHPNVLTVHDVGGGDGELYVVMELCDGWPMSRWISEATPRPGWRAIVDLYLQAGRGLSAAHRLGVAHRDVKPENILVARNGRVLIGDFGLAGLTGSVEPAGDGSRSPAALTQTGTLLGTPAYMAPEQHDGRPGDALSDQFSFCVSLFESLHGRRPFPGASAAEIAAAARAGRRARGRDGVPRAIDRVVARGLAADPARRHRSMDELLAGLERARGATPLLPLLVAGAVAAVLAAGAVAAVLRTRAGTATTATSVTAAPSGATAPKGAAAPAPAAGQAAPVAGDTVAIAPAQPAATRPTTKHDAPARGADATARARQWARSHPATDPQLLLLLADRAQSDRDGAACLTALGQIPGDAWPPALAERAQRRRASCEMLRGHCDAGRRLLRTLDGPAAVRGAVLVSCPITALGRIDDRIAAVAAQADEARYAGNRTARRKELEQALARQTASPQVQACFRDRRASRACGPRLAGLARAYQVVAESFLVAGDCREGALLDVMQSQIRFQSLQPSAGDPALRCRAGRVFDAYKRCAPAGEETERQCLRGRGFPPPGDPTRLLAR
jgi:hypothetical protein